MACISAAAVLAVPAAAAAETEAEDIVAKSDEAMQRLDSVSMTMELDQSHEENCEAFTSQSTIEQEVFFDSLEIWQETKTSMPELGEEVLMSYITEDGFFQEDGVVHVPISREDHDRFYFLLYEKRERSTNNEHVDTSSCTGSFGNDTGKIGGRPGC
ncbi:DUF6612 family protein [Alkalicoccus chagannorensis]|uniref:DUF6612 family protein n=1 Tax=Alkalicoccus chagannorensis TaxID=427072 RepID=UPI0003F8A476|nr:DUF6612 family protein [Alkalicoccus chagannorensis]